MPAFRLACLAYFSAAMPSATLGLLWPSIAGGLHQPISALGALLVFSTIASVIASVNAGRLLSRLRAGSVLAFGTALTAVALTAEASTPSPWMFASGVALFGLGSGAIDAALNAHAAEQFGARQINWMHAAYGAGATLGPVLATALLGNAVTWRWIYAIMGMAQAILALVFTVKREVWGAPPGAVPARAPRPAQHLPRPRPPRQAARRRTLTTAVVGSLAFTVVESGIEAAAGVWGYVFLTDGRGLTRATAGVAVSAYWAMMFLGRVVLGALAEHIGAARVLSGAVVGVSVGCALMAVPGPGLLPITGLMIVGLAAAPLFPLFTLTTAQRTGSDGAGQTAQTARTVSLQVAASAIGSATLPAGIGLAMGAFTAKALAPPLLLLSLTMCAVYGLMSRSTRIKSDPDR